MRGRGSEPRDVAGVTPCDGGLCWLWWWWRRGFALVVVRELWLSMPLPAFCFKFVLVKWREAEVVVLVAVVTGGERGAGLVAALVRGIVDDLLALKSVVSERRKGKKNSVRVLHSY